MSTSSPKEAKKFGTFLGVYTPSVLTILGLIMYLRFGWVVGNVGLGLTIVIVLLASSITFITALSASAIATNIKVGVGGEYFLVSRSLGLEPGGAIGIPLYFCRTLSITFYCFGLAEAILIMWPEAWGALPQYGLQGLTMLLIIIVTILSGKSASLVLRSQIPIMILIVLSVLALILGVFSNELHAPIMEANYNSAPEGFWYVFAVFFPAVTGFSAGIGMSGDLKNPRESIPRGSLGAVLTGVVVYMLIPLLLAVTGVLTIQELTDPDFGLKSWTKVALFGSLFIIPAVWGALLSSAFGSVLGGPRVLQALSMDGLAPKFLSKLSKTGQPTIATWVSGIIAVLAVLIGELNTIAQYVSIMFLTLYVTINVSAAVEDLVAEPSYRPQIRVPWYISMLGALGAIGVMFLVNPIACIVSLLTVIALYIWLRSRSFEQQWGDVSAGFWINITRYALLRLKSRKIHGRNWRPFLLAFVRDIDKRIEVVKLAELLGQNHGILSIANMQYSKDILSPDHRNKLELEMSSKLADHGLQAFCEVYYVHDFNRGIVEISNGHGLADLRTNTVVFGWSEDKAGQVRQLQTIRELTESGKNILLCNCPRGLAKSGKQIDIWWGGKENNGDLMLLLAFLLKLNQTWENAAIRILSLARDETTRTKLEHGIKMLLPNARISASVEVLLSDADFTEVLHLQSADSDLVFLGLPKIREESAVEISESLSKISNGLGSVVFVQNNSMSESIPLLLNID